MNEQDELLLTKEEIYKVYEKLYEENAHWAFTHTQRDADLEIAKAQLAKVKQHYEQKIELETNRAYKMGVENCKLQDKGQKRLDRPKLAIWLMKYNCRNKHWQEDDWGDLPKETHQRYLEDADQLIKEVLNG